MSNNAKRKQRGIKSSIGHLTLRPRVSRHGKPLHEVYKVPGRTITEKRPTQVSDGSIQLLEVVVGTLPARPMHEDEIAEARHRVLRALDRTGTYGKKNVNPDTRPKAPKESK